MQINNSEAVSIIVPVYNAEKTLPALIESVQNQTFKNFELICIDDGSKDHSFEICNQYATTDPRIKVYHKENGGVSSARNLGLQNASYENIIFIDSDDFIKPDYLENLTQFTNKYDFIVSGYIKITPHKETSHKPQAISALNNNEIKKLFPKFDNGLLGTICSKVLKKSIINKNNIQFLDIESEDELFMFNYIKHITSFKVINYAGYYYRTVENSRNVQHKNITEWNWITQMKDIYTYLFDKYQIQDPIYLTTIRNRFFTRYINFLLKGYFFDSKASRKERIKRWKKVSEDSFFKAYHIDKNYNFISNIIIINCKLKTFYIFDYLLNIILLIKNNMINKNRQV